MGLYVNVSGTWKDIIDPQANVSGVWKEITDGWVYVGTSSSWKRIYQRQTSLAIPAGGIVLYYNSGSIPSGWSLYTDTSSLLLGWDGTLPGIGLTGGNRTISFTSTTDGAHLGSTNLSMIDGGTVNSGLGQGANLTAGGHSHTCTGDASSRPSILRGQLIQADSEQNTLPAKAVIFGNNLDNVDELTTTGQYIQPYSNSGSATPNIYAADTSEAFTTNSLGNHTHGGDGRAYVYFGYTAYRKLTAGDHSHSFTVTGINWDLQRRIVKAFSDINNEYGCPQGGIIGWETNTPPDGWAMCDGSNGTIDLRSRYIYCDSSGSYGSADGDNTVDFSYTTNTAGSHRHRGSSINNYISYGRRHDDYVTHSHSGSQNISKAFPYLTLAFIQAL